MGDDRYVQMEENRFEKYDKQKSQYIRKLTIIQFHHKNRSPFKQDLKQKHDTLLWIFRRPGEKE